MAVTNEVRKPSAMKIAVSATLLAASMLLCAAGFSHAQSMASDEGSIELELESEHPALSDGLSPYSLSGATFGIYADHLCKDRTGELVTDEEGHASSEALPAGRYFIKQEKASPGFAMSTMLYQADVPVGKPAVVQACAPCEFSSPSLLVKEVNAETKEPYDVAGARLGGSRYVVSYYDGYDEGSVLAGPVRTWTFESDESGEVFLSEDSLIEGSPLYEGPNGLSVLPLGRYTLRVEKVPEGFIDDQNVKTCDVRSQSDSNIEPVIQFDPFVEELNVMRGDVMFRKTDSDGKPMAGIPFILSCSNGESEDAQESHLIVTDAHGDFSSNAQALPHSINTNATDEAVLAVVNGSYKLDESKFNASNGIWFSKDADGNASSADDSVGALPYGSYVLQELPCAANEKMNLATTQFTVNRDAFTVKLDNIVNTRPSIHGKALDAQDSNKLLAPSTDASIIESVSYADLVVGKTYRIDCSATLEKTGESVMGPDGTPAFASLEFVPKDKNGNVELRLDVDASGLAGQTMCVQIRLVGSGGTAVEQDDTAEQLIVVEPVITAYARDAADLDRFINGSDAKVLERLDYEGLDPAKTYVATCSLNDKATGNALRDGLGNAITAQCEFRPDAPDGHLEMTLPVDTTGIAGHDIVAFDSLATVDGKTVASHADMEDAEQTVKTVKLASNATDKADGDKMFDASSDDVTIIDTVDYANLVAGDQYTMKGALMDKQTGTALTIDGKPVTASVDFVPDEISGSVDVEYPIDASKVSSQVLVAFETVEHEGNIVAEHADLDDVAQTVTSEDMDPEQSAADDGSRIQATGVNGSSPSTGDQAGRMTMAVSISIICAATVAGLVFRNRRKSFESITRDTKISRK